ncbi:hypothetical protein MPTK1_8g08220 [Marchantia polymorpha subsp. ruderalis]|uniref:Uncharacterized protein n=1 Tax=Marchantia polymorpha TaxID=3197 RepID=A0A2R6WRT1_MARPO|nr:hypothetical protein MARPO_0063s0096 [Marchantia polymorpha]BBN19145.1 hypothetical protein Mp_8g08220 [Marchantia polymorpha subsp. ruderalis]|eukprot:PTQ36567.1 hypothetical protein MARPO_0063s0096 [Marchantia polymorpha]
MRCLESSELSQRTRCFSIAKHHKERLHRSFCVSNLAESIACTRRQLVSVETQRLIHAVAQFSLYELARRNHSPSNPGFIVSHYFVPLVRLSFSLPIIVSKMESNEQRRRGAWDRKMQSSAECRRLWTLVNAYRRLPRLMPLLLLNVAGFYTGLVTAAVLEQLYKENYWESHPGHAVPVMHPLLYFGPYKVLREDFSEEGSG